MSNEAIRSELKIWDKSDRGSIESGLALLPVTLLFLMVFQLLLAGSWQSIETAKLHDIVNRLAISNPDTDVAEFVAATGGGEVEISPWPQGRIVSVSKKIPIPLISALLGDRASIRVTTVAHV